MKTLSLIISIFLFTSTQAKTYQLADGGIFEHKEHKVTMVVNIATRCGYTGQLADLEKLYSTYKDKGLVLIGIPSNEFGGQSPEDNKEIGKFCRLKYGTSFPVLKKTMVNGPKAHPLINRFVQNNKISWNFEKFLLDEKGNLIKRFNSGDRPLSEAVKKAIESAI